MKPKPTPCPCIAAQLNALWIERRRRLINNAAAYAAEHDYGEALRAMAEAKALLMVLEDLERAARL